MASSSGVKNHGVIFAACAAIAALCYLNGLGNEFVFDDLDVIVKNPLVTSETSGPADIFTSHYWAHVTPTGNLYRPLAILSYALNHRLAGLEPFSYHLVNLVLHAMCASLVAALGSAVGLSPGGAFAAGALFAAHPIHTEAVTGVVGRADLMVTAAVLGAWLLHLRARRLGAPSLIGIGFLLAAGLLSKENAVVLPALMVASDVAPGRRETISIRSVAPSYLICFGLIISWLILRMVLLPPVASGAISESVFAGVTPGDRALTSFSVIGRYLWLLAVPLRLSADYSFEQIPVVTTITDPAAVVSMLLVGGIALAASGLLRRGVRPRVADLGAATFLIALLPVSNLLVPIGTIMAERLLYLPSVGFCLAFPALWGRLAPGRSRLGALAAGLLVLLYAARTVDRNADWKDQRTLFEVTTVTSPRSAKAHYNLGVARQEDGDATGALHAYRVAIAIKPDDGRSLHNAGLILASLDRLDEALRDLDAAALLDPDLPAVFSSLGAVQSRLGRDDAAQASFHEALRRAGDPIDRHTALYNLGSLSLSRRRVSEAIEWLERARDVLPDEPDGRYQLGLAYLEAGRPAEAAAQLERVIALAPGVHEALRDLALARLSDGDAEAAVVAAERARAAGVPLPPELVRLLERQGARQGDDGPE